MLIQYMLFIYILYPFSVETEDSRLPINGYNEENTNTTRFNVWGMLLIC